MRMAFILSSLFHVGIFVVAYFGLPGLKPLPILTETPVMVELVDVSDVTRAPPRKREEEPKKTKVKEAKKDKPKPPPEPPKRSEAPPPPAPPEPKPETVAAVPLPPEPKPQAKKKAEPDDKPKPKAKPKPSPVLARATPKRKPKPVDAFESVFKTVQRLKKDTPKQEPKAPKKDDFQAKIAQALASKSSANDVADKVTISEIDLVRQQIRKCWNVQGGYKDIENMTVQIKVQMNPDGTVRRADIERAHQYASDPFKKAFAESAYRAVLNKRCQPFKLPPDKYGHWKSMTLNFDPRDML